MKLFFETHIRFHGYRLSNILDARTQWHVIGLESRCPIYWTQWWMNFLISDVIKFEYSLKHIAFLCFLGLSKKHGNPDQISDFCDPCVIWIGWMTLKNNRVPPVYYSKLCAPLHSNLLKLELSPGNAEIRPNWWFLASGTLKLYGWPWKIQYDIPSIPVKALCIIYLPSVNWNWDYHPEILTPR